MSLIEEGFLERNKKIIIIAVAIFLIAFIAGAVISHMLIGDNYGLISKKLSELPANETTGKIDLGISTFDLFVHNLAVDLLVIVGGVFFSIISIAITAFNGLSIGTPFGTDFKFAVTSILPHSIFEYSGTVIALIIAFIITKLVISMIKTRSFRGILNESKTELKDILVLFIVMVILVFIAAVIEANITPAIVNSVFGLK